MQLQPAQRQQGGERAAEKCADKWQQRHRQDTLYRTEVHLQHNYQHRSKKMFCSCINFSQSSSIKPLIAKLNVSSAHFVLFLLLLCRQHFGKSRWNCAETVSVNMVTQLTQVRVMFGAVWVQVSTRIWHGKAQLLIAKPIHYRLDRGKPFSLALKRFGDSCDNCLVKLYMNLVWSDWSTT